MKINKSTFEAEPDFVIIDDDVKEEIISYCSNLCVININFLQENYIILL